MSVDYVSAIGYGFVVEKETVTAMEEILFNDDDIDTFHDEYCHCLNGYIDDSEYFIGIIHRFGANYFCLPLNNNMKNFTSKEIGMFWKFFNDHELMGFVNHQGLAEYAITFVD